jgi:hypothetical protein
MFPGAYAEPGDLKERRYLVATLLYDAWLPRALESQLPDAERKAFYWSGIYGATRTRITEVWVKSRPAAWQQAAHHEQPRSPPMRNIPTLSVTIEPREGRVSRLLSGLARLDVSVDPAYAKAMADAFLLYVGSQLAIRVLGNLKLAASLA